MTGMVVYGLVHGNTDWVACPMAGALGAPKEIATCRVTVVHVE